MVSLFVFPGAQVMAGSVYRNTLALYASLKTTYPNAILLSQAQYQATDFYNVLGEVIVKRRLSPGTNNVLVNVARDISTGNAVVDSSAAMNVFTTPIADLNNTIEEDIQSLLLDENGVILQRSANNIGYINCVVADKALNVDNKTIFSVDNMEQIPCGPVVGAFIEAGIPYADLTPGSALSDRDGKYSVVYRIPPCYGFNFNYEGNIALQVPYITLNPKALRPVASFYALAPIYETCFGEHEILKSTATLIALMTYIAAEGISAASTTSLYRTNFNVDVMILTGKGYIANSFSPLPVEAPTTYQYDRADFTPLAYNNMDLDGDGVDDEVKLIDTAGDGIADTLFFYLGGNSSTDSEGNLNPPDLTRVPDKMPDLNNQGLLKQISPADLNDTDLYFIRVSNGQLITYRNSLVVDKIDPTQLGRSSFGGVIEAEGKFFYEVTMRGPKAARGGQFASEFAKSFKTWQSDAQMNAAFYEREADHLRVGEQVQIIAINRATGYLGSLNTTVGNAATSIATSGEGTSVGVINFPLRDMVLYPPNLRISAERTSIVNAGLTKGDENTRLIGFEGSGLSSDKVIAITTEWTTHDGKVLPEAIDGYTGRLAKIVGPDKVGELVQFPIRPGRNLQLIRIPEGAESEIPNEHYYVHVSGEAPSGNPNFEVNAGAQGPL